MLLEFRNYSKPDREKHQFLTYICRNKKVKVVSRKLRDWIIFLGKTDVCWYQWSERRMEHKV